VLRPPLTSSDVFTFRALMKCSGGRLLRITENVQFFYGANGTVRSIPNLSWSCTTRDPKLTPKPFYMNS
jgi:hypothetical protein